MASKPSRHTVVGPQRQPFLASEHLIATGHYLGTQAGMRILDRGGNAVDAGVAAGLAINVCQSDITNLGGVAPIMVYSKESGEVTTISGLGGWPGEATLPAIRELGDGGPTPGVARTVVPAAVDAWLTALSKFGTMRLADVAEPAIELAERGFAVDSRMARTMNRMNEIWFDSMPTNRRYYFADGVHLEEGARFQQPTLARTIRILVEAEQQSLHRGRVGALEAARDLFYTGALADEIVAFYATQGALLRKEDMASFRVAIEPPLAVSYRGHEVLACRPWCQGIVVLQALGILEGLDVASLLWTSPDGHHLVAESLKLAFSDRHAFVGDPEFVDVPTRGLLDPAYASLRGALIDMERAHAGMPPHGDPWPFQGGQAQGPQARPAPTPAVEEPDTSYIAVVDRDGNAFSATPSDAPSTPVVPSLGLIASSRGYQSWVDPEHPASIMPRKRPRMTPCPGMVMKDGRLWMVFGSPGNDRQPQAMLQFLLNRIDCGMNIQQAIDAPRLASFSFPASGHPHKYEPGLLRLESHFSDDVSAALAAKGHGVAGRSESAFEDFGSVCAIEVDQSRGVLVGGADPRRTGSVQGW